jgi:RimJ/RimL family protein N-acetyltransferase
MLLERRLGCVPKEIVGSIESQMKRVKANIPSKVFDLFGVRIVDFKRRLETCGLTLRLYRWKDLLALLPFFTPELILEASGIEFKASSLFSFYKWLRSNFQVIYVIEIEENDGHRIVGFAGLYNMKIGKSLWLSLAIFNPRDRRRGYGTRALELLLDLLQKNSIAETVYAEVLQTNTPSISFLRNLGFEIPSQYGEKFLLRNQKKKKISILALDHRTGNTGTVQVVVR